MDAPADGNPGGGDDGDLRAGYGRTLPQAAFDPAGVADARLSASRPAAPRVEPLELTTPDVHARLAGGGGAPRYQAIGLLGAGATGEVHAVLDRDLGRPIAVKALRRALARDPAVVEAFLGEARLTAALKHPGVLPVLDLDVTAAGRPWFSTSQVEGRPLGAIIAASTTTARDPAIAGPNRVVSAFIAVCNAVGYAHHQRIVHQDIKPDNILLGAFGEVIVLDWGCAARLGAGAPAIYGTPLYMSPEQARRDGVDERSDVYAIGATLMHAVLLRPPLWCGDDEDAFWRRKRAGEIDPPDAAERASVPAALLAIALKAMAADPARRYASAADLRTDLEHYQAGLAVSAHADGWLARARRWHRRHARVLWPTLAAAAVTVALAGALYGERLKELATWGRPVCAIDGDDDSWRREWRVVEGGFERRDGRLVTTAEARSVLLCRRQWTGAIAIEYDGEILPDARPCDVSVVWCPRLDGTADAPRVPEHDHCELQVGAFDGTCSEITVRDACVAFDYFTPAPGSVHRIRDEIDGDRITISVDGRRICEYRDPLPFTGGWLGLMGFYPGKAFGHVRIYARGLPEKLPATALGDLDAERGRYADAAASYARVADAHPGSAIARDAIYREGLCWFRLGRRDDAFATWRALDGSAYAEAIALHRLDRLDAEGDGDGLLRAMEALLAGADADLRHRVATQWSRYVAALTAECRASTDRPRLEAMLALRDRAFADDPLTDRNAARALLALGRLHEVVERFPRLAYEWCLAAGKTGRLDLAIARFPDQSATREPALYTCGRSAELPPSSALYAFGLVRLGRGEEALRLRPDDPELRGEALIALGRLDEAVADPRVPDWLVGRALAMLGRAGEARGVEPRVAIESAMARRAGDEALRAAGDAPCAMRHWVEHWLGLEAWIAGDRAAAERWFAAGRDDLDSDATEWWDYRDRLVPCLRALAGDRAALDAACRRILADERFFDQQHPWYRARALLGQVGEAEFLAQPHALYAEADLRWCQGVVAELDGRAADAAAAWTGYLAVPAWRRGPRVDPVWDRFAEWRLAVLAAR